MTDQFGRNIKYLRVSITDRCNLKCFYCMPHGAPAVQHRDILRYEEIARIVRIAASLGITKVRITGGEPLVRKDCVQLIKMIREIPEIDTIAMTTNGILLPEYLSELVQAGLNAVNISLDTLQRQRFRAITGCDGIPDWKALLRCCVQAGITTKTNTVLLAENREEWEEIAALAQEFPICVRFIEQMPLGQGIMDEQHTAQAVLEQLRGRWSDLRPAETQDCSAPARYYTSGKLMGAVGVIAPMTHRFCRSCDRVRLTSTGQLKLCLSYATHVDVRARLRSGASDEEIQELLRQSIYQKPANHCFGMQTDNAERQTMNRIGG